MKRLSTKHLLCLICTFLCCVTVTSRASQTLTYDANGNLISDEGKFYEYNDANKLVRVRHGSSTGAVIAEYVYDHAGQRIKKTENGVTTWYIGKHFEQKTTTSETEQTKYYFAGNTRVAKKDQNKKLSFYHTDHLGSTSAVTNAAGKLVEHILYYPFGDVRSGGSEQYTYTGKEKDLKTDLYYYEARYYGGESRHFTQADWAAVNFYDPQNLNRYSYVKNNPINYIDPSGNTSEGWLSKFFKNMFSDNSSTAKDDFASVQNTEKVVITETAASISQTRSERLAKYASDENEMIKKYDDYKSNCKEFARSVVRDSTGIVLDKGYEYATDSIDNVSEGDVIQYKGVWDKEEGDYIVSPHTAIVTSVDGNNITVMEANYKKGTIQSRTESISKFKNYGVYKLE